MSRHDPDLAFARRNDTGAVRANQPAVTAHKRTLDPHHVQHRDPLGDTNNQRHAGVDGLKDGIRGKGRRHIDDRCIGTGVGHRLANGIEDRKVKMCPATLTGGDTANHFRAIGNGLFGMEGALRAGKALTDDTGFAIDQY